jgi:hypothetical protein
VLRPLIALLVAVVPGIAGACEHLPPLQFRQEPNVPYEVYLAPPEAIIGWCHKDAHMVATLLGCTYMPNVTPRHDGVIVLNQALSQPERECVLMYEKAHLPPNNWYDPVVEATAPDDPSKV